METTVMKQQNLVCALLYLAVLQLLATVPGGAESPKTATVSMRPYKGTRTVVAVKLNGVGPYDFMVDTGATVTVLDAALFHELGLQAMGSSRIVSSAGTTDQILSAVKEITLDSLSVRNVAVVSMKSPMTGTDYRQVRGILGENFLRHFDILIDNQHRTMTLDAGDGLADSLAGEHLPVTFPPLPLGDEHRYQPRISVTAETYGSASMLLDSGADTLVLLQRGNPGNGWGYGTRLRTVNGSLPCESTHDKLLLGQGTVRDLAIMRCQTVTVKPSDAEGILPTAIFKRIFISHAGSYAIVNPTPRCNLALEMAVLTTLSQ
jgi:predicted aspartyl protease